MSKKPELVPVVVRLRLPDGREFDCHAPIDDGQYAHSQGYWWTVGNGACDCNRSLYLNREHGLGLGVREDDDDDVPCLPCGMTVRLVSLIVNGERVAMATEIGYEPEA